MTRFWPPPWRLLLLWTAILIAGAIMGLFVFVYSGIYSVAASQHHFSVTNWLLKTALRRSVETHALLVDDPKRDLTDPSLVRLGAGHYAGGCAPCHGAPGEPRNAIYRSMLPQPPYLPERVGHWSPTELFWIVNNGFKYTGMPAWPARNRGDEVWAVVAFLRQIPDMKPARYAELVNGNTPARPSQAPHEIMQKGAQQAVLTACARCHGDEASAPTSDLVPRLAGQTYPYLERALTEYARGARPSGIMQPVADELTEDEIRQLARAYSSTPVNPTAPVTAAPADIVERGRRLAFAGAPQRGIPRCLACHSEGQTEHFPRLGGQPAAYLIAQLRLFKQRVRDKSGYAAIMSSVAQRLSEEEINAAAHYFSSLEPPSHAPPPGAQRPASSRVTP